MMEKDRVVEEVPFHNCSVVEATWPCVSSKSSWVSVADIQNKQNSKKMEETKRK